MIVKILYKFLLCNSMYCILHSNETKNLVDLYIIFMTIQGSSMRKWLAYTVYQPTSFLRPLNIPLIIVFWSDRMNMYCQATNHSSGPLEYRDDYMSATIYALMFHINRIKFISVILRTISWT
jgi:hypothetical protein